MNEPKSPATRADAALLAIAHRAGNHPSAARRAEAAGADIIEADVRLHRARLEVRHMKTMRALPLLWDRWRLAPGWTHRLVLPELLDRIGPGPGAALMLDLKGEDDTLPASIINALADMSLTREILVCGQNWRQVDQFVDVPNIRALHSIGQAPQLAAMLDRAPSHRGDGFSVHRDLLNADVAGRLRAIVPFLITWPINDAAALRTVTSFGVDGVTTDSLRIVRAVVGARAAAGPPAS